MVQNAQGARITKGASRSSDAFSLPTIVHFLLSQSGTRFPSAWQTPPRQLPNADSLSRAPRSACRLICRIPHRRGGEKEGSFQLDCFRPNHEHPVKSTGRDEEAQFRLCRRTALRDRRAFCITGSIVRKLRTIDGEERWAAQHGQYSLWMTLQRFVNRYRACSPRGAICRAHSSRPRVFWKHDKPPSPAAYCSIFPYRGSVGSSCSGHWPGPRMPSRLFS
jgi:hypothetical protein